jgi:hypothetical protein
VIMGSLDARIVGPLFGPYAASKHALVGLSDALRCELRPAGIEVVLLEPGVIATPIWQRGTGVLQDLQPQLPAAGASYRSIMEFAQWYVSKLSRIGASRDRVARAVVERWSSDVRAHAEWSELMPPSWQPSSTFCRQGLSRGSQRYRGSAPREFSPGSDRGPAGGPNLSDARLRRRAGGHQEPAALRRGRRA